MQQNQVIALVKGKKTQGKSVMTSMYQIMQKKDLFYGFQRSYTPKNEEGEALPNENKLIQISVDQAIKNVLNGITDMFNLIATMDIGNCTAKADIIINDVTIAKGVPATHLIFLEKQIIDLKTFISSFPVLDAVEKWSWSSDVGCYVSEPKESSRTAKVLKHKVLYEATKEHPAQIEKFTIDEIVGTWKIVLMSGCVSMEAKKNLLAKIEQMEDAIKIAREKANSETVEMSDIGSKILDYIFK